MTFINDRVIPLRIPSDHQPLATEYRVNWTPALLILDSNGKEHHRTIGFLDENQLVPALLLGSGNLHFNSNHYKEALQDYATLLQNHPHSDAAPEAIFQQGVSLFKSTHDPKPLRQAYELLDREYRESLWRNRAYPYRLIP